MKCIFLLLSILLYLQTAQAQNRQVDSINSLIAKAKTDTGRINLLNVKANSYAENNLDSAISIATANIDKAKQIHYLKGEADANRLAGTNLALKGMFAVARSHFTTAERIYNQTKDSSGLNKLNRSYGIYYGTQSMYDSSIFFFKKNVTYFEKTGNTKELSSAYQNIAVSYTMLTDYQQTLIYQDKALKLAEKANDITNLAYINLNMGIGYSNITDYVKSEELFRKAIDYAKQAGIKNVELYGYANLASTLNVTKRYPESYASAMKAVTLGKALGDNAIVATCFGRAGVALTSLKRFGEAQKLMDTAISMAEAVGAPLNIYQAYTSMGFLKKEQNLYTEAIVYYEKGFAALKDGDMYDEQTGSSYGELAESYEKAGFYQKALTAFKLSTKITDSVRSRDNVRKATEQSMNHEFDKKQQAQNAIKEKEDRDNEVKLVFLAAFLLVFITLATVALFAYKREQKAKLLLNSQKKELESTLIELKSTQAQLIQSEKMASLGELTAGIAHEIQNPLNFVNNYSEVSKELLDEMKAALESGDDADAKEIANNIIQNLSKISHHGKRADAIVKGMLQHSRKNTGIKEAYDINALCDEYLRLSYHGLRAKDKNFNAGFTTDFDATIGKINIVPQDVGRVLLNLFNNAFYAVNEKKKVAGEDYKPLVSIQTKTVNNKVEIKISDNGNGIPQPIMDKIFQPFFTTKPTGQGTGLGLSLSYDIITKEHGGTICVESEQNSYTSFLITLPI